MTVSKNTGPIEIERFYRFFLRGGRRSKSQILNHCILGTIWQIKKRKTQCHTQSRYLCPCAFLYSLCHAVSQENGPNHFSSISIGFPRRYSVGISPPLTDASRIRSQLKVWSHQNFSTKRYNKNLEKINHVKKFRPLHQQVTGFSNFYRRFNNIYCASL